MKAGKCIPKPVRIAAATLGAVLTLVVLLAFLAGARAGAAPRGTDADADPAIEAITVTASLPISDTHPGEGVTKTVYFNNAVPGVITLTFEIGGTPVLTLTTGAAFGDPERVLTSSMPTWSPVVTYTVETGGGDYPGVAYTATNTNSLHTVIITYVHDVSAPMVFSPSIAEDSAYIYAAGTSLYYTNTMGAAQAFEVQGRSTDALAGLHRATFSYAFGSTPDDDLSPASFAGIYNIPAHSTEGGVITASVHDWVSNIAVQIYTYDLDGAPPYTGSIVIEGGREYVSQTLVLLTLFAADAGCGVGQMCIGDAPTCSAWEEYTTTGSLNLDAGDGWKTVYAWYRDHLGNASGFYTDSVFLDTIPPVVTVTAPAYTTMTTFAVSWEATDPMPGSGVVPSYTVEYRQDGGVWNWLTTTAQLSLSFGSAQAGHVYDFRIGVDDRAGNGGWAGATTRVGPFRIYLPLSLRQWVWWYRYDIYEPNDTPAQAWGPLASGQVYEAYIWDTTDRDDYYHFTPSTDADVQVTLTRIPDGCDYDLYVYYYDGQYQLVAYSNQSGNVDENVTFTPVAGREYYIRVYPYSGSSSQQPYHLKVIYQ